MNDSLFTEQLLALIDINESGDSDRDDGVTLLVTSRFIKRNLHGDDPKWIITNRGHNVLVLLQLSKLCRTQMQDTV